MMIKDKPTNKYNKLASYIDNDQRLEDVGHKTLIASIYKDVNNNSSNFHLLSSDLFSIEFTLIFYCIKISLRPRLCNPK